MHQKYLAFDLSLIFLSEFAMVFEYHNIGSTINHGISEFRIAALINPLAPQAVSTRPGDAMIPHNAFISE